MSIGNSSEEDRPSVGRALQQARSDAQLTVDEVSASTRVRVPIVQAIEQDDFSRCGGDVYARGHIRALARAVGADGDALVAQFDDGHGGRPAPTPAATLFEAEKIRPEPRRPNWTAAMVAAIVAVVGFVGFTLAGGGDSESSKPVAQKTPTSDPSEKDSGKTGSEETKAPSKPSESPVAGAAANKVTARVVAKTDSWLSAEDHNGRLIHEGVLKEGQRKTFTDDKKLNLVLGNAGGVKLYVNGKEIRDVGEVGQVQRLTYTRGDPEQG